MSEQCVRGCVRPCPCSDCKDADTPQHEPQPAPAEEGKLCKRDANRLYRWLGAVLDDTLKLDVRNPVDYGWDKESNHQKVTGSPALANPFVVALTDHRSQTSTSTEETAAYSENQDQRPPFDIPGELCSWALMLAEEHNLSSDVSTMAAAVTVLTNWWETLVSALWVDEFYTRMHEIRQLLDQAHNVERPKPMGECFTCNTALYHRPGCTDIKCPKCGRRYDGLSLVKLEIQRRREAHA
jgi:hypothetical protein